MKKNNPFEPGELERLEGRYSNDTKECNGDPEEILNCIECLIQVSKNEILSLREQLAQLNLIATKLTYQSEEPIEFKRHCNSPIDIEEDIEFENLYIDYLKTKRESIPKGTRILKDNEKFEILRILGLFNTFEWNAIQSRQDQNMLLSELLVIHSDTAKNLLNSLQKTGNTKGRLKQSDREELEKRIKSMQNGV